MAVADGFAMKTITFDDGNNGKVFRRLLGTQWWISASFEIKKNFTMMMRFMRTT